VKTCYIIIHLVFTHFIRKPNNSHVLYEFYKTPFCRTRFLEHDERSEEYYKANNCDKMAYKTSVIQYFFYFAPILNFKLKKGSKHNAKKKQWKAIRNLTTFYLSLLNSLFYSRSIFSK
jgi:hypothetical protein